MKTKNNISQTKKRKYFGTDGIRGRANTYPMTGETALKVGMAAGEYFTRGKHKHNVVAYIKIEEDKIVLYRQLDNSIKNIDLKNDITVWERRFIVTNKTKKPNI